MKCGSSRKSTCTIIKLLPQIALFSFGFDLYADVVVVLVGVVIDCL